MIITDLKYYEERKSYVSQYSGIDTPGMKLAGKDLPLGWFENYTVQDFDYQFNNWGFRGPEYDQYVDQKVNICLGDSFTVNLGGPVEHGWVCQLDKLIDFPCINLGMDGAGNDAIKFVYEKAIKVFDVQNIFVMYSYIHRRLLDGEFTHFGNTRFKRAPYHTDEENFEYFEQHRIPNAYEVFLPKWCWGEKELKYIEKISDFDYPDSTNLDRWVNRDRHHACMELNIRYAEHLFNLSEGSQLARPNT